MKFIKIENWFTPLANVYEDDAIILYCARDNIQGEITTLVNPPQAGHMSDIADHAEFKSITQTALRDTKGGVFIICYKGATFERRHENEKDLQLQLLKAMEMTNARPIHVVGLCQGGWVVALTATNYPARFDEITVAGAPIDTSFKSIISPAGKVPLFVYKFIVNMGLGIISGKWMLHNWMKGKEAFHKKQQQRPEKKTFYNWWFRTQDLAGGWYLWAIDNIFINNRLPDILDIQCHCNVVVGKRDDICVPKQTIAIQMNVRTLIDIFWAAGGHLKVFMGIEALEPDGPWSRLFKAVTKRWEGK